jgi:hypothetical protein
MCWRRKRCAAPKRYIPEYSTLPLQHEHNALQASGYRTHLQSVIIYFGAVAPPGRKHRWYIFTSPTDRVVQFPFRRLVRLAGLRWRYSNPPPRGPIKKMLKGKASPVTGRGGPSGCETSRLPHILDNRPPFNPRKIPGTHFCSRQCRPQGHGAAGRIRLTEKSNEPIGNRIRDLPAYSIVPQPTTLPRAPRAYYTGKHFQQWQGIRVGVPCSHHTRRASLCIPGSRRIILLRINNPNVEYNVRFIFDCLVLGSSWRKGRLVYQQRSQKARGWGAVRIWQSLNECCATCCREERTSLHDASRAVTLLAYLPSGNSERIADLFVTNRQTWSQSQKAMNSDWLHAFLTSALYILDKLGGRQSQSACWEHKIPLALVGNRTSQHLITSILWGNKIKIGGRGGTIPHMGTKNKIHKRNFNLLSWMLCGDPWYSWLKYK